MQSGAGIVIEMNVLDAARVGDCIQLALVADNDKTVLDGTNERGNTCLHVAAICGHEDFCISAVELRPSLLSIPNMDGETALVTAVKSNHGSSLATVIFNKYLEKGMDSYLLKEDNRGCNVLHHAIRSGFMELALHLIEKSPVALSRAVNIYGESPIFMAVQQKGFKAVYEKLLNILQGSDDSAYAGAYDSNALHAAVKYDEKEFVDKLLTMSQPDLVKRLAIKENRKRETPMTLAAHFNRGEFLEKMLKFDLSLGYQISTKGRPLISNAAERGHINFARKLLEYCPDAPYLNVDYENNDHKTCLHEAVCHNKVMFVEFLLHKDSKLWKIVNMQDGKGNTALHLAVRNCNTKMVSALLSHRHIDVSVVNNDNCSAIWLSNQIKFEDEVKTINWNKIYHLILHADHRANVDISNLHSEIENKVIDATRKDVKSLTKTYAGNTSVVAILIATVTFAAAFTLPGGYSSGAGSEGLAIMARKLAFQAFLIFDTLAMCSSLAVAFLCLQIRWMDFEFLDYYRSFTKKLMWFAYIATTLAFATGLYTVVAPRVHWLAIIVCVLSVLLPILMVLMGQWPILQLKTRMVLMGQWPILQLKTRRGERFDSKFLDMV